jgi:hypothetical protein
MDPSGQFATSALYSRAKPAVDSFIGYDPRPTATGGAQ